MSAQTLAVSPHFKAVTPKQLVMTGASIGLPALTKGTDAVTGTPENIFVQALAGNSAKIYLNIGTATVGGVGIELSPGANVNLPLNVISQWQAIGTASDKLNILYQGGIA